MAVSVITSITHYLYESSPRTQDIKHIPDPISIHKCQTVSVFAYSPQHTTLAV